MHIALVDQRFRLLRFGRSYTFRADFMPLASLFSQFLFKWRTRLDLTCGSLANIHSLPHPLRCQLGCHGRYQCRSSFLLAFRDEGDKCLGSWRFKALLKGNEIVSRLWCPDVPDSRIAEAATHCDERKIWKRSDVQRLQLAFKLLRIAEHPPSPPS
jgi:hypothetical protein